MRGQLGPNRCPPPPGPLPTPGGWHEAEDASGGGPAAQGGGRAPGLGRRARQACCRPAPGPQALAGAVPRPQAADSLDLQPPSPPVASLKYTLMRSSCRSLSPWYVPVGSTPCSSHTTWGARGAARCSGGRRAGAGGRERGVGGPHLPELGTNLVAALPALDVHDLTHGGVGMRVVEGLGVCGRPWTLRNGAKAAWRGKLEGCRRQEKLTGQRRAPAPLGGRVGDWTPPHALLCGFGGPGGASLGLARGRPSQRAVRPLRGPQAPPGRLKGGTLLL